MGKKFIRNLKSNYKKTYFLYCIVGIIIVVICVTTSFNKIHHISDESIIAEVDGEPITVGEFKIYLNDNISQVFSYFHEKYGAEDSKNFWVNNYNGEIPADVAKEKALEQIKKIKYEQILMKNKGIIDDISYVNFIQLLNSENMDRQSKLSKNQVIYGPKQYQVKDYYNYLQSNRLVKLKSILKDNELKSTDKELMDYYNNQNNKDDKFKIPDFIKVQEIEVSWDTRNNYTQNREEAYKTMQNVLNQLQSGVDFSEIAARTNKDRKIIEQTFDENSQKSNTEMFKEIFDGATKLNKNDISGIIESNHAFYIIKCVERRSNGYKNFEDVKEAVSLLLLDENYNEWIEEKVKDPEVIIHSEIYTKYKIR